MAWNDVMVPMLRLMIGDLDGSDYEYDDDRLEQQILLAAQLVQGGEIEFDNLYTISIPTIELSPDPVELGDNAFINLVSLKAACMLDMAAARIAAGQGISISDNGSRIALSDIAAYRIKLLASGGFCEAYKKAKQEYVLGNLNPGIAIVSPFRVFEGFDETLFSD